MSGTPLTAMTALEPLKTNLAAYTYTSVVTGFEYAITDELTSWNTWSA